MHKHLSDLIKQDTPEINPDIGNGLAVKYIPYCEAYIDDVFKAVAKDFPQGLEYVGCVRCDPREEYSFLTSKKSNKRTYDIARSDTYLMKYMFRFNGVDLPPRYLHLPFINSGGFISMSGPRYAISPVLSDKVISLGTSNIFIRLLRDKLTFERLHYNLTINGKRELVQIVWSLIYHKPNLPNSIKSTVKANCSLAHYLFCKYGFTQTFKKFTNCVPVIGMIDEVNVENYPADDWVIIESTRIKPRGVFDMAYRGTELRVAVKKIEYSNLVKQLVAGFFYVADYFPQRIEKRYIDNTNLWRILLGHILFPGNIGEGKLLNDINEHFDSLDEYIDAIVQQKLKDIGYVCHDVYELFAIVLDNFSDWLLKAKDTINSMYDKELSILYFILLPITSAIFKLHFRLKKIASKKQLKEADIIGLMAMNLKPGIIFAITKQYNGVSTVSYSGDNKIFEITSMLAQQKTSSKGSQNDRAAINDPGRRLHISVAEVAAYLSFTKSDPSGRSQLNPHVLLDSSSTIIRRPDLIPLLNSVQEMIKRD